MLCSCTWKKKKLLHKIIADLFQDGHISTKVSVHTGQLINFTVEFHFSLSQQAGGGIV